MSDGLAVCVQEPLARHTPLRTGGPCDAWVVVHRTEALATVVSDCRQAGWKWRLVGAGTRTAFRDGPVEGVVMRLGTDFARLERVGETTWRVGAAVPVPALLATLAGHGHSGLEHLAAVPGSVGASVVWDEGWGAVVVEAEALQRDKLRPVPLDELVGRSNRIVSAVTVTLRESTPAAVERAMARARAKERAGAAWRLAGRGELREVLRSVQLPLVRLRRAIIPDAAPELLVNTGRGGAADLALLQRSAADRVKRVRGLDLEPRLRWVGTDPAA